MLLFFFTVAFISCDGRDRAYKTNAEVLKAHKLLDSFSEKIIYIPEKYTEVFNDTTFSNGYNVSLKMYTDATRHVVVESRKDAIKHKTIYRDNNVDLIIKKDQEEILNLKLSKDYLMIKELRSGLQLSNYYLKNVWIETQENRRYKGVPLVYLKFYAPSHKSHKIMEIFPLGGGRYQLTEID